MLLKLRRDVAVTASGRIYHYVATYQLLRRDVISPPSLSENSTSLSYTDGFDKHIVVSVYHIVIDTFQIDACDFL